MGGWAQAITSGVGEGANDVAKGAIANTEQQHAFTMDFLARQAQSRGLDIEQQKTNNENAIAHQQLTLQANQQAMMQRYYEQQGFRDSGVVEDASGNQSRLWFNAQLGKTTKQDYPQGYVAPDSPAGKIQASQIFQNAGIPKNEADLAALKLSPTGDVAEQVGNMINLREQYDPKYKAQPYATKMNWALTALRDQRITGMPGLMLGGGFGGSTAPGSADPIKGWQDAVDSGTVTIDKVPTVYKPFINASSIPKQMPPSLQAGLGLKKASLVSTLSILDDLDQYSDLLQKLPTASLVDMASSSGTVASFLSRTASSAADTTRIDKLAGDLTSLNFALQSLQAPLSAGAFRNRDTWENAQQQSIQPLRAPGVNAQVLANTKMQLHALLNATNDALGEGGNNTPPTGGNNASPKPTVEDLIKKHAAAAK